MKNLFIALMLILAIPSQPLMAITDQEALQYEQALQAFANKMWTATRQAPQNQLTTTIVAKLLTGTTEGRSFTTKLELSKLSLKSMKLKTYYAQKHKQYPKLLSQQMAIIATLDAKIAIIDQVLSSGQSPSLRRLRLCDRQRQPKPQLPISESTLPFTPTNLKAPLTPLFETSHLLGFAYRIKKIREFSKPQTIIVLIRSDIEFIMQCEIDPYMTAININITFRLFLENLTKAIDIHTLNNKIAQQTNTAMQLLPPAGNTKTQFLFASLIKKNNEKIETENQVIFEAAQAVLWLLKNTQIHTVFQQEFATSLQQKYTPDPSSMMVIDEAITTSLSLPEENH